MIKTAILRWARARQPDFIVGGADNPYLRRHWLLPRNRFFNIYVHQFLRSDDDRALHDHPWLFNISWLIRGHYIEHLPGNKHYVRAPGDVVWRRGGAPHRVELFDDLRYCAPNVPATCWTVFITGPVVRPWGFYCDKGWVHWQQFTAPQDKGAVGRGCE